MELLKIKDSKKRKRVTEHQIDNSSSGSSPNDYQSSQIEVDNNSMSGGNSRTT